MNDYQVKDLGDPRRYFTMIPNMVDDMGLSVYAFRLYVHLKRVAGDDGLCWQSTQTLATECGMSTASISRAKKELTGAGLINITSKTGQHGGRDYHEITIVDIWNQNAASYLEKQSQVTERNLQMSPEKLASYPGAIKEEPIKNNPNKNKEEEERTAAVFRMFENEISAITPMVAEDIKAALDEYPFDWFEPAIKQAVRYNARSWAYVAKILERKKREGPGGRKNGKQEPVNVFEQAQRLLDEQEAR